MSQVVKQTLNEVLENILQNSAQLKQQVEQQEAQVTAGKEQLHKFDVLVASLQIAIDNEQHLTSVVTQVGANALFSPTVPATASSDGVAGLSDIRSAIQALDDAQVPADRVNHDRVG